MMKLLAVALVALLLAGCGLHPDIIRQSWGGYFLFPGPLADAPRLPEFDFDFGKGLGGLAGAFIMIALMMLLLLVGIAVAVPLIGGIVGGVVASKRKKSVWEGVFVGGSLSVFLFIFGCMSYHYFLIARGEREAKKQAEEEAEQVEEEAKIWAKKIGFADHRIILEMLPWAKLRLVFVESEGYGQGEKFYYAPNQEVPYSGWVKEMHRKRFGYKKGGINYIAQLKDGKIVAISAWKPNGEKCPRTNVDEDGNGVVVDYRVDGTEYRSRRSIRNGIFR